LVCLSIVKGQAAFALRTEAVVPVRPIELTLLRTALPLSFGRIDGSGNDATWIKSRGRVPTADELNKSYIQKQERNALGKIQAA
jgi:hypothetical protein